MQYPQARKTFQKLIYVSNLVFGDRQAAFLLPWTRVFGLTDAQVGEQLAPHPALVLLAAATRMPPRLRGACAMLVVQAGEHAGGERCECWGVLQVYVAKRDNAKGIFKQYLDANGGQLQVRHLLL